MSCNNSYIICSTPRSGSTLLCDLLSQTQIAGRPHSYFMDPFYLQWAAHLNVSTQNWRSDTQFDQSYLDAVLVEGAGQTQVFGLRLQWESLEALTMKLDSFYPGQPTDRDKFKAAFGTTTYIHLFRQDKVAQAVSLLRAEQSGLWHLNADGTERERLRQGRTPKFDAQALVKNLAELKAHDAGWLAWFAKQKIKPVSISYEALSLDPKGELARILSALKLDSTIAEKAAPKTAKMSNRESQEWVQRLYESM